MMKLFNNILIITTFALKPLMAQEPFETAIQVNDTVISYFEIEQRTQLLGFFGTEGNLRETAIELLIDDKIRLEAAIDNGIDLTEEDIFEEMDLFASQGNLTADELIDILLEQGIYEETYRDFIIPNAAFRRFIQQRFGRSGFVSEDELNRTLDLGKAPSANPELRFAEIIIPFSQLGEASARETIARLKSEIRTRDDFASQAQSYSVAPSAFDGGKRDWILSSAIAPSIAGQLLIAGIGGVTNPIELSGSIGIFQLLGVRDSSEAQSTQFITLLEINLPLAFDDAETTLFQSRLDHCDDAYGLIEEYETASLNEIKGDLTELSQSQRDILATLDLFETHISPLADKESKITMLCERVIDISSEERENFRSALTNARLTGVADGILSDLRSKAVIVRK